MKSDPTDRLIHILKTAYRDRETDDDPGTVWRNAVMREVRASHAADRDLLPLLNRYVWRFACGAATLALLMAVYAIRLDGQTSTMLADLYIQNPIDCSILQSLDMLQGIL